MKRLLLSLLALLPAPGLAADSAPATVAACIECHGVTGAAARPGVPHIDGQHGQYMLDSMRAFGNETRKSSTDLHKRLSRDALNAAIAHYAEQKTTRQRSASDPALVASGETLYNNRCADCHMDNGRQSDKDAPILAGQDVNYLSQQLIAFRKGDRRFPTMMDDSYRGLGEADLSALAHFFAAQDPAPPPSQRNSRRKR